MLSCKDKTATTKAESGCFKIKILNELKLKLNDEKFINKSRLLLNAFTRVRRLPFEAIVLFITQKTNASLSVSLFDFFEDLGSLAPSKSAFTQGRAALCYKVFKRLNLLINKHFYQSSNYKRWKGFRILSVDGSTLRLPDHKSMADKFSRHAFGANKTVKHWMARVSILYDVLNNVVIDAQMENFKTSEAHLCHKQLGYMKKGDLVIFDRYYASYYMFSVLLHKKVNFLFRMKHSGWKCVQELLDSKENELIVEIVPYKYSDTAKKIPFNVLKNVKIRLIKHITVSGEVRVYATSLLDQKTYSSQDIIDLYQLRWGIEEAYKTLKTRLDITHFSGKTVHAVQQDFYANIMLISLNSVFAFGLQAKLKKKPKSLNKDQRTPILNNSFALVQTKKLIRKIYFLFDQISDCFDQFKMIVETKIEFSRKGQSNPRKAKKGRKQINYQNIKPI